MADGPELEAIRKKRLQEMAASQSAGKQRLAVNRINLVRPEKTRFIEDSLISMAKSGQIRGAINEEQLIQLLSQISSQEQAAQSKITSTSNKAYELRTLTKVQLTDRLNDLKQELLALRVQKVAGAAANKVSKINVVRKAIARVMTVINQSQRNNLKMMYSKRKFVPLDLRPKKTRAIRRQLTKHEKSLKTERQRKRLANFPLRRYAISA